MKTLKNLLYLLPMMGMMTISSCTDVENIEVEHIGGFNTSNDEKSEEYYANLRAYKQQAVNYGRPVAFGWYSNWAPAGAYRRGYLTSMPDSMDIVSMWSGAPSRHQLTPEQKKDKEFVQKVKGTKLLEVSLLSYIGKGRTPESVYEPVRKKADEEGWSEDKLNQEMIKARWKFWGYNGISGNQNHKEALARYAKALCDSLVVNEWDGFDIDWEIGSGVFDMDGSLSTNQDLEYLIKEMNNYIGPKSDPEGKGHKLICIDGGISYFVRAIPEYVDYFIIQSYGGVSDLNRYPDPRKIITTDNFESNAHSGGSLLQQAASMPNNGYKGGVGAFRMDNDYNNTPDYKWMRQAIQINQKVFNEWKENQDKLNKTNEKQ